MQSTPEHELSAAAVIEEPPPRPDPQPEPTPEPVPDPLPEPEPPAVSAVPVRIRAPDAATAALLMQRAIGGFNPRLIEIDGRWIVLLRPDRPQEELIRAAIELVQASLEEADLDAVTVEASGRRLQLRT